MRVRVLFAFLAMAVLPSVARAQSAQTYCHTEDGRTTCNTYNSDGTLKQTYCQDSFGNSVNCNSYNSNGTMTQTHCHDSFGNSVNCTSYNSDGTMKQTTCRDSFGNTTNCTSYNSNGSTTQTDCHNSFGNTVNCTSITTGGTTSQSTITMPQPPPPTTGPSTDQSFNNGYEAGQAIGSALGTVIGTAVAQHRKTKFCKKNPNGSWRYADGSVSTCESINAHAESRVYPPSPQQLEWRAKFQAQADEAKNLMEGLRHDIIETKTEFPNDAGMQAQLGPLETSWANMRNIFCDYYHGTPYTDLDGNQQVCQ